MLIEGVISVVCFPETGGGRAEGFGGSRCDAGKFVFVGDGEHKEATDQG